VTRWLRLGSICVGRLGAVAVISLIVAAVFLELMLLGDTAARFNQRSELTQALFRNRRGPAEFDIEAFVSREVLPYVQHTPIVLSTYVVPYFDPDPGDPVGIRIEPRMRFWAQSKQGEGPVQMWPVTSYYIQAARPFSALHGRIPQAEGEAVLTFQEASQLFGGDPIIHLGNSFRVVVKASDEVLKQFPEGTFSTLAEYPDSFEFKLVGVCPDGYPDPEGLVRRDTAGRQWGPLMLLPGNLLWDPGILQSFALWPREMRAAMSQLPVAASVWMTTEENLYPQFARNIREIVESTPHGLRNMGTYTAGRSELQRNTWYFQFGSIADMYRTWPSLERVAEADSLTILGPARYTMYVAPLIVFLVSADRFSSLMLLVLLPLLGVLVGYFLTSRESRWLAVSLAYAGSRTRVLSCALCFVATVSIVALAAIIPVLAWFLNWELHYLCAVIAKLSVHYLSDLLPSSSQVLVETAKVSGLFVVALFAGSLLYLLRAYNTEVGLLLKREG